MEKLNKKTGEIVDTPVVNALSSYNTRGEEIPDPKPSGLHLSFKRPLPLGERIRKLVQNELLARELDEAGVETFEDADDFDVPEDPIDPTPYEETFDPDHTTCREQELRAGFVEERPRERIAKAKEVILKAKTANDVSKANARTVAKAKLTSDAECNEAEPK